VERRYKYPTINTDTYRMNGKEEEGWMKEIGKRRIDDRLGR
jgi:hypothetical protein